MTDYPSVNGYRVLSIRKPDRQLSYDYLQESATAAKARIARDKAITANGANCVDNYEFYSGDTLPSDRDAELNCARCPVFDLCGAYASVAKNRWGVYAGKVYGRHLEALEKEEDE